MSDYPVASRKNDFTSPPRAFVANGGQGQCSVFATSTTAGVLDLTQGFSQGPVDLTKAGQQPKTPTRNCLTVFADTSDLAVVFGPTLASVTAGNVPSIAAAGTVSGSGVYTGAAGTCFVIKAGTQQRFLTQAGVDMFMGFVASGVGKCRVYQSSPDEA